MNFMALAMLPLIFILPCMNIIYGLAVLLAMAIKSSSLMMKVASGVPSTPSTTLPVT